MELLKELDADYARLEELISAINRTNNSTRAGDGTTLSDLLAKRDCLNSFSPNPPSRDRRPVMTISAPKA
mgnify:CR=1 FL=1